MGGWVDGWVREREKKVRENSERFEGPTYKKYKNLVACTLYRNKDSEGSKDHDSQRDNTTVAYWIAQGGGVTQQLTKKKKKV